MHFCVKVVSSTGRKGDCTGGWGPLICLRAESVVQYIGISSTMKGLVWLSW